jgi:phenylpropionate dioxygenase-like ring-hydroxylating dioxygenase large terminal subunit
MLHHHNKGQTNKSRLAERPWRIPLLDTRPEPNGTTMEDAVSGTGWVDNLTPALGAAWYPVAASSEVTDRPLAIELLGVRWVLVRLAGELVAFADTCPHRLMPLSAGTACGNTLRCSYHGWEFDAAGTAVLIPSLGPEAPITARARLSRPADLLERYGVVWMAPEPPASGAVALPEWDDDQFECRVEPPIQISTGCWQLMDNACDVSHFAFVHAGTFGGEATATSHPRTVTREGWTLSAVYEAPYRVLDDPRTQSGELPELQPTVQTKTFHLGATLLLRIVFPMTDSVFTLLIAAQPERAGSTRLYRWFARNDIVGDDSRWEACLDVERKILAEDATALTKFRDYRLPLDLRKEVHVPADKLSLAYRRLLTDLVKRYEPPIRVDQSDQPCPSDTP